MKKIKGFTLVEIMIVVAIIGLLAAIAIPNFVQARAKAQQSSCMANLKQITGALSLWALDAGQGDTATVVMGNLVPTYIRNTPYCPLDIAHSGYVMPSSVSSNPSCPKDSANHHL